jgi:[ribosomal protein S18]-alanine N-acetyltransferase
MLIERMQPRDREAVHAIARLAAADLDVDAELQRAWAELWVGRLGAGTHAAGFALTWRVADELHVINIATHPDERRRGVAAALMRALIDNALGSEVVRVLLEVRRSNHAAISLYRKHGFCAIGLRRAYYSDNGEDAVEMLLTLDPQTRSIVPGRDEVRLAET